MSEPFVETIPHLIWAAGPDGAVEFVNGRWRAFTGQTPDEALGGGWIAAIHPDDRERAAALWDAAVQSGAPYDAQYRLRAADGTYRWFVARAQAVHDDGGVVHRWYGTATDVDDRVRAERTLQFLLGASGLLASSLDVDRTIQAIGRVTVPLLAEFCAIYLRGADGGALPVHFAHEDPQLARDALAMTRRWSTTRATEGIEAVMRTGVATLVPRMSQEVLAAVARSPEHLAEIKRLGGIGSVLTVPLRSGGETIGALQLLTSEGGRELSDADMRVAESLAARASVALDNARLYERERHIATAFQDAALPVRLPSLTGVALAAVYQPGSNEALVGGDWYDAVRLRDGRLVISVGDVAGSGLEAAVTMQAVRQALRTTAHVYPDPLAILDAADRTLKSEYPERIVTAFVAIYDAIEAEFVYGLAGHPPPFVRRASGEIVALDLPGPPLGIRSRSNERAAVFPLLPGDLVVLYTDGVIEATRDVVAGESRLRAAIAAVSDDAPDAARAITAAAGAHEASDDVAVLTAWFAHIGDDIRGRWTFASADAAAAGAARRAFCALLAKRTQDPAALFAAELVFGELVSNVVRHAPGSVDVAYEDLEAPVLHVLDRGAGFVLAPHLPSDLLAERGRGLFLVWTLTDEFGVSRRTVGGAHARATLRLRG